MGQKSRAIYYFLHVEHQVPYDTHTHTHTHTHTLQVESFIMGIFTG